MTRGEYQRGIGHMHKMMDKHLDKVSIIFQLKTKGFDDDQINDMFGIVLRATVNKLKAYYSKEDILAALER